MYAVSKCCIEKNEKKMYNIFEKSVTLALFLSFIFIEASENSCGRTEMEDEKIISLYKERSESLCRCTKLPPVFVKMQQTFALFENFCKKAVTFWELIRYYI